MVSRRRFFNFNLAGIPKESVIDIIGEIKAVPTPVYSTTQKDVEIAVEKVIVVSAAMAALPLQIEDLSRPEHKDAAKEAEQPRVLLETRLNHRVIDLRTRTNQAIMRVSSQTCALFREFWLNKVKILNSHSLLFSILLKSIPRNY
jgi:aspartyl-tRNA synthetase